MKTPRKYFLTDQTPLGDEEDNNDDIIHHITMCQGLFKRLKTALTMSSGKTYYKHYKLFTKHSTRLQEHLMYIISQPSAQ